MYFDWIAVYLKNPSVSVEKVAFVIPDFEILSKDSTTK